MAEEVTIGGSGTLFVGENKTLRLEVLDAADLPVNCAGWTIVFDVRTSDSAAAPALISLTATVSGTYDAVRATNAQRASVALTPALLTAAGSYRYAWTRTNAGYVAVLRRGPIHIEKATNP